ncbi:FAD-dependent monooxygenase [Candidatus Bathyarchaeota archaeon]|nr:MAG: FAD-dependent monooxygenase [Candidatus Bathyarchaeota archaeon]
MEDCDVLIVGAGIGGLATGCALASNGLRACILEARPGGIRSMRGLTLQPNGLTAIGNMGLLDQVVSIGSKTTRVAWHEIGGKPLATFDYSVLDHPHNYLLTVVPDELELVLRDAFSKRNGMIYESTLFREIQPNRSERVLVKAERDGSPIGFSAKIIVGADGWNSKVRQALQIPVRVKEYCENFFFMLARRAASLGLEARQYVSLGEMAGFFPTQESTYIFYYVPSRIVREFKSRGLESFKKRLANIEPDVSDSLDSIGSWGDVADTVARRVDVKTWTADRAALLGDAAHALDPSWAQGANLSLQDAAALASTIERCFELNDFTAEALKGYEKERRKQTKFVQVGAERTARFTTTESSFYYRLGKRILQRTGRNKELMLAALKASCGLTDHLSMREKFRFIL